eukprot:CAMPEP_0196577468 /NCGR_PEP_ID=MMETSP1081-20130531/6537_1 /TAXON_ID=36882 /ORGANISM="Pyramimonas amylifera, Strain CCMP720" /LENGTH=666 /DNA_ID=CAMNT_0041896403 /DNA_START=296 /DNA_END=2296 /DNA_ORIENTATION=+
MDKRVYLVPLIFTLVCVTIGIFGVLSAASITSKSYKSQSDETFALHSVLHLEENARLDLQRLTVEVQAKDTANAIIKALYSASLPTTMVEAFVRDRPESYFMEDNFEKFATIIVATLQLNISEVILGLAPNGIMAGILPYESNKGAIGHDLLHPCKFTPPKPDGTFEGILCPDSCGYDAGLFCYPSRREPTLEAIRTRQATFAGPVKLVQGSYGVIVRHPMFLHPGELNSTFNRSTEPHDCAADCVIESTGERFWGLATVIFPFESVLIISGISDLTAKGYAFKLTDEVLNETLIQSVDPITNAPIAVSEPAVRWIVELPYQSYYIYMSPIDGWIQLSDHGNSQDPGQVSWKIPLCCGVAVLSIFLGLVLSAQMIYKRQHELLLQAMLPPKVLPYIARGLDFCEVFPSVTILFSDIVSYTNMVGEMPAMKVVSMLNELYTLYDQLADEHSVYKVETIGDAFMCAGGVPDEMDPEENAICVASMALSMIHKTNELETHDGLRLKIRVGIHSGPVVAAVIGIKMPHYCLFGDTVNVASRMESNSESMRVHISEDTYELLRESSDAFSLEARGLINIKGKGEMRTYWVTRALNKDTTTTPSLSGGHLSAIPDLEPIKGSWQPLTVESFLSTDIERNHSSQISSRPQIAKHATFETKRERKSPRFKTDIV